MLFNTITYDSPSCEMLELNAISSLLVGSNETFQNSDWSGQGGWYEANE